MTRRASVRSLFAVVALAVVLFGVACGGDDDDSKDAAPTAVPTPAGVTGSLSPKSALGKKVNEAEVPEAAADGRRLGAADAKVVIEAYEDFGCSHCLDFTANVEPQIFKDYVATGKVAFHYKYFPLRQHTARAAQAAECANRQGKFWVYHRALFVAQAEANAQAGPSQNEAFALDNLVALAGQLKLDADRFGACMVSGETIDIVQVDLQKAGDLGLPGTPSFVINGQVTPAPADYAGWKKLLDGLLK